MPCVYLIIWVSTAFSDAVILWKLWVFPLLQHRFVPVIPKAIRLLNRIKEHAGRDEYILSANGVRFNARQVSHVLEHYAKATGKDIKRTHKIRKTFASVLNANGVPIDTIRECLGHTNLQTTMAYLFDPLTNEETYERLSAAF